MKDEARIVKVIKSGIKYGTDDEWMSIPVRLDDGGEAFVYVGGDVEITWDERYQRAKARVKRKKC